MLANARERASRETGLTANIAQEVGLCWPVDSFIDEAETSQRCQSAVFGLGDGEGRNGELDDSVDEFGRKGGERLLTEVKSQDGETGMQQDEGALPSL
jgi:hypothetical protein